jgi:hypothetical protein
MPLSSHLKHPPRNHNNGSTLRGQDS